MDVAYGLAPPFYPNVVTSVPGDVNGKLDRIRSLVEQDQKISLSVKDSFSELELDSLGFDELFTADWLYSPASTCSALGGSDSWERCAAVEQIEKWRKLWLSQNPGGDTLDWDRIFAASQARADRDVLFVASWSDVQATSCAVLNCDGSTVGISNFSFDQTLSVSKQDALAGCLAIAAAEFPELPIVGYETESSIDVWERSGFDRVGELRVWLKPVSNFT